MGKLSTQRAEPRLQSRPGSNPTQSACIASLTRATLLAPVGLDALLAAACHPVVGLCPDHEPLFHYAFYGRVDDACGSCRRIKLECALLRCC